MKPAGFTPLTDFLRPPRAALVEPQSSQPEPAANPVPVEHAAALGAARRFRAGLCDALDVAVAQCLRKVACEVLGRELELAQADIAAIAKTALDSCGAEKALSIRANAADLQALRPFALELVEDATLRPGDFELVLRSGTIDLTLGARLDTALALWNA